MRAFAEQLAAWQRTYGRTDLPWQRTRDPYRIWVSEVMLQQTQVATVIPYYERFISRYATVHALAEADLDEVLAHWSGLGYYSRARHLHRAARIVRDVHDGRFPCTQEEISALPGVGRSTAAAITVFAFGHRNAILDGNVKRVLARVCGIAGYPGEKRTADELWSAAERLLPVTRIEAYTQGLMDLGATVCVRHRPNCLLCPVATHCVALRNGRVDELPVPRPRKARPHRTTTLLVLDHDGKYLLEKRPAAGIWGGLWCFPELAAAEDPATYCLERFGITASPLARLPDVEHGFTHFTLTISLQPLKVSNIVPRAGEAEFQWMPGDKAEETAVPAPVRRIFELVKAKHAL